MFRCRKVMSILLVLSVLLSSLTFSSGAISFEKWLEGWEEIKQSNGYITLTPGEDETQMNFSWQSAYGSLEEKFFIGTSADMSDATEVKVRAKFNLFGFEWTHEVTATDLEKGTTYYYQYTENKVISDVYSFTTDSDKETTVLFVTDSQIGRSSGEQEEIYKNDTFGWTNTLGSAFNKSDKIDFILSSGDQVEDSFSEEQYTYFESPGILRSTPVAAAIGNHDFYTPNYSHHFNNPNDNTFTLFRWPAGQGYYFSYNDVLFIVVDSNNFIPTANRRIIKNACKAYPEAKWRVLMMHHSPFDARGADDIGNKFARGTVVPFIDEFDIDICLSGHDHYYSRSYMIKNGEVTDSTAQDGIYKNPEGTLYITQNSSSGSNYSGIGDSISEYCEFALQENRATYSLVSINAGKLTVTTYHADDNKPFDKVTIEKD